MISQPREQILIVFLSYYGVWFWAIIEASKANVSSVFSVIEESSIPHSQTV
jgi:hypothetical protein